MAIRPPGAESADRPPGAWPSHGGARRSGGRSPARPGGRPPAAGRGRGRDTGTASSIETFSFPGSGHGPGGPSKETIALAGRGVVDRGSAPTYYVGRLPGSNSFEHTPGEGGAMNAETTPGQTGSVRCPACGGAVFFVFAGGPHHLECSDCGRTFKLEVVHDGTKWRARVGEAGRE